MAWPLTLLGPCHSAHTETQREAALHSSCWITCDRLTGCREIMRDSTKLHWNEGSEVRNKDVHLHIVHYINNPAPLVSLPSCPFFTSSLLCHRLRPFSLSTPLSIRILTCLCCHVPEMRRITWAVTLCWLKLNAHLSEDTNVL